MAGCFASNVIHPSPGPFPQGKGRSGVACDFYLARDSRENAVGVLKDVVVPEADDAVTLRLHMRGTRGVGMCEVLAAVAFDCDAKRSASEVHDEISDLVLADKLRAAELAAAKVRPQALFGIGRTVAQFARHAGQSLLHHRRTPIRYPLALRTFCETLQGKRLWCAIASALASLATPALAQAPAPAQEWPAVELAPGVVFAADGSVEIEAGPGGGPGVTFWRPVLFREESKYPVGGRMDCRVVAATQGYSDAAFDLEATYEAEKSQRKREGHVEEDRARAYDGDVRELDIITRRRKPHDHHVLSYIAIKRDTQLVQIRRNCSFVHGYEVGTVDYLAYVNRYTGLRIAAPKTPSES